MGRLRDDFAALIAAGEAADLARGALAIARIGHPDLDPEPWLARLDALAAGASGALGAAPADGAAAALAHHLFVACGFRGNRSEYYDPRNSYLNDVLERRTGIPITLAVVLIEVGARLGVPLEGVGFPGHFLVRTAGAGPPLLLDPFFDGRPVGDDELLARYRTFRGIDVPAMPPDALERASTPAILARMLRNLLHAHLERKDRERALAAADLLLVLVPRAADVLRLRGLLYEQLDCFAAALDDLRAYLALVPEAPDVEPVRARIAHLARLAGSLH
jgi:regulator of sirC expression with transglutaminase-like and TPR domain